MIPKTRYQKEVADANIRLSKHLPDAAIQWAARNTLAHFAFRTKSGKTTCMDCGHQWMTDGKKKTLSCPHCKMKLKLQDTLRRTAEDQNYFSILTTQDGLQVQRIFSITSQMKKGEKVKYDIWEVARYWINAKGQREITGRAKAFCYASYSFSFSSGIELRKDQDTYQFIADCYIYPRYKLIPELKRNGLKGNLNDFTFNSVASSILKDSRIETLAKADRRTEVQYFSSRKTDLDRCWPALRIVLRQNYLISDVNIWADYIRLLERCGRDIRNAYYVCPADLHKAHSKYMKMIRRINEKERMERDRQRAKEMEERFRELKGKFFGLTFTDGQIVISVLDSIEAYYDEGEALHHCVGQCEYYLKPESLVLTARIDGRPIETVELSLETFKVLQSRGFANENTEYHEEIINLVQNNIAQVQKLMVA